MDGETVPETSRLAMPNEPGHDNMFSNPGSSRKRPRDRVPVEEDVPNSPNDTDEADAATGHDSKRSRSSRWRKDEAQKGDKLGSRTKRPRRNISSPEQKRYSNSTPRPSKFLEGSMNDRASNKPPSPYLGEEKAMEQYTASESAPVRASADTNTFYDAGIEPSKPSGMYRFGKAIANAFNPSAWRGLNGMWKEKDKHCVDPGKALMDERQEKAQKAYAELKKSGFKGTQGNSRLSTSEDVPSFRYDDTSTQGSQPTSFRDSAIDVDEYRSSTENNKDDRRSLVQQEELMPAPIVPLVSRSISPMPNASSRRSSLTLRTPSLQTLKKATSHIQLPSIKRNSAQSDVSDSSQQIKKQPSRKDLAKQQKLVKRVSNLETQLETARRQLELALSETPAPEVVEKPGKKAFKPGALPSLPSERILNAHINDQTDDDEADRSVGVKTRSTARTTTATLDPTSQLCYELEASAVNTPSSKKRKGRPSLDQDGLPKPNVSKEWDVSSEPKPAKTPARPVGRPRKSLKVESPNLPMPARPLRRTSSLPRTTPPQELRRPSTLRTRKEKYVPPVPALPTPVSPSQVDKVALLSMRSTPNISVPFGGSPEDLQNLRKTYPMLSDKQIEDLLGEFKPDGKVTDYTSTAHQGQPASPALAHPSPTKTQGFKPSISKSSLRNSKQELKGPNNSPVDIVGTFGTKGRARNGKFVTLKSDDEEQSVGEEGDVVADLSPSKAGKELPPYPKGSAEKGKKKENEKPLPKVQRENYAWDEDVF